MQQLRYCPDCIELLKPDTKKIGKHSKWLVCPKCGLRTREAEIKFHDEILPRKIKEQNKLK